MGRRGLDAYKIVLYRQDDASWVAEVPGRLLRPDGHLGGREKATRWLHQPNRALGSTTPLHQLDTELGARQVEDVLLRIAHGVYS